MLYKVIGHMLHKMLIVKTTFLHEIKKNNLNLSITLHQGLHDHMGWGLNLGGAFFERGANLQICGMQHKVNISNHTHIRDQSLILPR